MVLTPSTMFTVLPLGGMFVKNGSLAASDFILIIILSVGLITPLITCMSYSDDIGKMRTIIGEVTGLLEKEELKRPPQAQKTLRDYSIALRDVHFGYQGKEVLHGIKKRLP